MSLFNGKASIHLFPLLVVGVALGVSIGCTSIANAIFSGWAGSVAPNPSHRPGDGSNASQPSYPSATVPVPDYDDASRPYCEQLGSRAMPVTRCVFPLDSAVCYVTGRESNISCVKLGKMDTLAGVKTTAL